LCLRAYVFYLLSSSSILLIHTIFILWSSPRYKIIFYNSSFVNLMWESLLSIKYPYPNHINCKIDSLVPFLVEFIENVFDKLVCLLFYTNFYYSMSLETPICIYLNADTSVKSADNN
jgi:hypothetical protein